jgi:voltage-gated potassium channel
VGVAASADPTTDGTRTGRPVDPAPTSGVFGVVYEVVMVTLAITVVALLARPDIGWTRVVNLVIWGVFVVDYVTRLALSGDRKTFMRRNIIDLVAILPADFFRAARALRVLRILRLLRATTVLWRVSSTVRGIAGTNALGWVLAASGLVVVIGAGAVMIAEPQLGDFGDALWWSIVTATTVGYGDLAPASVIGRIVAVLLMIVGIGTIGMITGSIATFFLQGSEQRSNPHVDHLREVLDRWDDLTGDERRHAAALLAAMADAPTNADGSPGGAISQRG